MILDPVTCTGRACRGEVGYNSRCVAHQSSGVGFACRALPAFASPCQASLGLLGSMVALRG